MISRVLTTCLTCEKPITARVQVGHELEQPEHFSCPHCGTDVCLTLILTNPPIVQVRFDENCEAGDEEGTVVNLGAGFVIPKDKLHVDRYFPSLHMPRARDVDTDLFNEAQFTPQFVDKSIALGTLPNARDKWHQLKTALQLHRTGQHAELQKQLSRFWESSGDSTDTLDEGLFGFLMRFLAPRSKVWIVPLQNVLKGARETNHVEFGKLVDHYESDLKSDRWKEYSDIFSDYFSGYGDFSQTLLYVRQELDLPLDSLATSTDFRRTRLYYGDAFEVLGTHLDVPVALNNILSGRAYDQMMDMDLNRFRTINKAGRTRCFATNPDLSWLAEEYDSTIRNASHHKSFRLNDARTEIMYRSGGTGATHSMTYAEYLYRCNRLTTKLMMLAAMEILMLYSEGRAL